MEVGLLEVWEEHLVLGLGWKSLEGGIHSL